MVTYNLLFDTELLKIKRNRALKSAQEDFVHLFAIDDVKDRLSEINKSFYFPAVIGFNAKFWAEELNLVNPEIVEDNDLLGLKPNNYDLVIHAMCLHWHNDPVGQLIQIRKSLKPDGLVFAFLYGGRTLHELRSVFKRVDKFMGSKPACRVAPMSDIKDLGSILSRAGLALTVADSNQLVATYESPLGLIDDLRKMAETNVMIDRPRKNLSRKEANLFVDFYKEQYTCLKDEDRVEATFEVMCMTGWAPSETQQKPLRPGSAQIRLASALGNFK